MRLRVNGRSHSVDVPSGTPLLWVLRDEIGLTGAKYGCGEGLCGACTVLVDGQVARSCGTPAGELDGAEITTIEGLACGEQSHPLQQAFLDRQAFQCGYCTPGMILTALALLESNADPSEADSKRHLEGNVCRCGTYPRIVEAVRLAAKVARDE